MALHSALSWQTTRRRYGCMEMAQAFGSLPAAVRRQVALVEGCLLPAVPALGWGRVGSDLAAATAVVATAVVEREGEVTAVGVTEAVG